MGDRAEILSLLSRALGWEEDDRHKNLFEWKHEGNPFGPSPIWVAYDDLGLTGFRALMRWEFLRGSSLVRAVRAVDTATDPRAQGRGVFRALTLQAVEDMVNEGMDWVFNTPNPQSRPGYLSMGWQSVGHLPISFRPARLAILSKIGGARSAGELWSMPTSAGEPAAEILADASAVEKLLSAADRCRDGASEVRTHRSAEYLAWRYGRCPVGYRGLLLGTSLDDGVVLFRTRRRGTATELVISETILMPGVDRRRVRSSLRRLFEETGADYGVALGESRPRGWLPLPGRGPLLTWRELAWTGGPPTLREMKLSTGDVELF